MTRRAAALVVCLAALAISSVQAIRPGPMLRGGTIIVLTGPRSMPAQFLGSSEGRGGGSRGIQDFLGFTRPEADFDAAEEDALLGRSFEASSVFGRPSWFDQQPDMAFELFGPVRKHVHHKGCRHARAPAVASKGGADAMAKQMASERFRPESLLAAMLAVAQEDDKRSMLAQGWNLVGDDLIALDSTRQEGEATIAERPFIGIAEQPRGGWTAAVEVPRGVQEGKQWRARDFIARSVVQPVEAQKAAADAAPTMVGCEHLQAFPDLQHACRRGRGQALLERSAREAPERPAMSWGLYNKDGQLNGGALVFVLLSIACVAVWARLVAMWCCCALHGPGSAKAERRQHRRLRMRSKLHRLRAMLVGGTAEEGAAPEDGLAAPLLNPLAPEKAFQCSPYKVKVAASAAGKSPVNYVTLQYQPLSSEAR